MPGDHITTSPDGLAIGCLHCDRYVELDWSHTGNAAVGMQNFFNDHLNCPPVDRPISAVALWATMSGKAANA
jgi:hypothetical protein